MNQWSGSAMRALRSGRLMFFSQRSLVSNTSSSTFSGGLAGFLDRLRKGRVFRADLEPENWRQPWDKTRFRYPSPGSQRAAAIPQGPQERIFDIKYYDRDTRRKVSRETEILKLNPGGVTDVAAREAGADSLPPTPGQVLSWKTVGWASDFEQ